MNKSEAELALNVCGISKCYRLGKFDPYHALKQRLKSLFKRGSKGQKAASEEFWALKNINFKVKHGEVVGIIGKNGAGKSTLLKILSRITSPSHGYVDVYGRIGSLLEVGTGFHPDLTGRENIYLNASIIGMKKDEIQRQFDAIVAFAELEQFIDTPVKHYSSGMYMRLAFAVSSHLSHEILILDEVLAVGDSAFQQKCLAKMENEAKSGRTVLFVSHDMGAILAFCNRCLLIDKGEIVKDGSAKDVVALYQERTALTFQESSDGLGKAAPVETTNSASESSSLPAAQSTEKSEAVTFKILTETWAIPVHVRDAISRGERFGEGHARFLSCSQKYYDAQGRLSPIMRTGYDVEFDLHLEVFKTLVDASVAIQICDRAGNILIDLSTAMKREFVNAAPGDKLRVKLRAQNVLLKPETYRFSLWVGRYAAYDADCLPMGGKLVVETNPEIAKYPEINFLGVYVCPFTHHLSVEKKELSLNG